MVATGGLSSIITAAHVVAAHQPKQEEESGMEAMKEFAGVFYREGALDPKTTQLVALAGGGAAGCTS
jgi:hypothetical protein